MSNDNFLRTLFNAGEQIRSEDFNQLQRQMHMLLLEMLVYPKISNALQDPSAGFGPLDPEMSDLSIADGSILPFDLALCPFPGNGYVYPTSNARELSVATGPIMHAISDAALGDPAEASPIILPYWMTVGEFTLTTAVGDATNPRIDLVEMKLELVDDGPVTRVFAIESVKATLDLAPLTSVIETIVRARNGGLGGNSLTLATVADGAGAGSLTQNGNAWTFHYQSGVTTVANFETAIAASSMLEVATTDGVGTLTSPGDTFSATALSGGTDQKLASQSVNKKRRVQATFQIKQGTPGATPAYPAVTSGFVAIAAVRVPATHNAVHALSNLRDMRWPIGGVRPYDVHYNQMNLNVGGTTWTKSDTAWKAIGPATSGSMAAICPVGGNIGRLVGLGVYGHNVASMSMKLIKVALEGDAGPAITNLVDGPSITDNIQAGTGRYAVMTVIDMMDDVMTDQGTRAPNSRLGTPVWTNGERCGAALKAFSEDNTLTTLGLLAAQFTSADVLDHVQLVRFFVAHGMG